MVWQKLILLTESDDVGQLETWLGEEGAVAITLENGADRREDGPARREDGPARGEDGPAHALYEDATIETPVWPSLKLSGLFDSGTDIPAVIHRLELKCKSKLIFQLEALQDQIWETVWQKNFKPIRFGEKLWVCPTWCDPPQPDAVNLMLDPGLAFGTGTHETTALCLEWLEKRDLTGKTIIDYGCGSGILAIAALLLGSEEAIAIDNDLQAIAATKSNGEKNNLDEGRLKVYLPHQIPAFEADIVLANILSGPLVKLSARIISLTKPAGSLLLSGILTEQRDEVIRAYETDAEIIEMQTQGDWICLHAKRLVL